MENRASIYIAGHTGLVGSALLRELRAQGYTNIVIRLPEELDLRRQSDTEKFFACEKPEYVFLAAAKVGGILANSTYTAEFIYDNLLIAANVIHSAHLYGVKKLLNLGTSCIYPKLAPQPLKESSLLTGPLEPTNEPYAIAKITAIKLCRYYNEQHRTDFISVMPTNLYGPGDSFNLETSHVLPALIRKLNLARLLREKRFDLIRKEICRYKVGFGLDAALAAGSDGGIEQELRTLGLDGSSVKIWGSGNAYREFLYVDDLAKACIFLMQRYGYREIGEFINIGEGKDLLIRDLVALVQETVAYDGRIIYDESKPTGTPRKLLDVSRIRQLGWRPAIELHEGIRKVYDWYLKQQE